MPIRKAQAAWHGSFREGEGTMRLGSGSFEGAYSYRSRMEDSEPGTNPEELLAAAHAGCFSMSLARRLSAEGHSPERIHTEARVRFGRSGEGYAISRMDATLEN
jgi:lipoyl-dependent peroxiredoxin